MPLMICVVVRGHIDRSIDVSYSSVVVICARRRRGLTLLHSRTCPLGAHVTQPVLLLIGWLACKHGRTLCDKRWHVLRVVLALTHSRHDML